MSAAASPRPGRRGNDSDEVRERILTAFSEKARRSGTRSIVMGELAAELRMSATTLYKHFGSKDDIVTALVERWAEDLAESQAAMPRDRKFDSAAEGLMHWAKAWSQKVSEYSPAFWDDIERDHPEAFRIFEDEVGKWRRMGANLLRPSIRKDLHADTALANLNLILDNAPRPEFCERLGVTRREAIETSIAIWARGALENAGKLHPITTTHKKKR
ncbi:MAG: TetR/AcrR family transcriptional regulator [Chrysiogenetes bacterium]|nr:TetR/AcrR family transcriptional regulator [Chrysiogenetes bacterium]